MISLLLFGFLVGIRHALEADHVAAVATLVSRNQSAKQAAKQGVVWGLGHTLTLFIIGAVALMLETMIVERLAQYLEIIVGFMLIILGLGVLKRIHHSGIHKLGISAVPLHANKDGHTTGFPFDSLFIGFMHGIAGSAALIVITMGAVDSFAAGLLYIAIFGLGSIVGMAVLSVVIAIPFHYSAESMARLHSGLHVLTGMVTIIIGLILIYKIGITEKLFIDYLY